MHLIWGVILVSVTLKCWIGQLIIAISPKMAVKIRIAESEDDLDPTFFADMRGEAIWDSMILWILPVAGLLLVINNSYWAYFGLVGGGTYLYFVGRGIVSRMTMQRLGINIGKSNLKVNFFLVLWGIISVVTITMAVAALT